MKSERKAKGVRVVIRRGALEAIFDECDRHNSDETGGRLLGNYSTASGGDLNIEVTGVIEPGPGARRTATSFFQDGEYQAEVFRKLEEEHPDIEHLGNWHSHHVNGLLTLSQGDRDTYHRIANHHNHNLDFFYALLVITRNDTKKGADRYKVRHYVLYRGDPNVYEIPKSCVHVVRRPIVWPREVEGEGDISEGQDQGGGDSGRARDQDFLKELYPNLRPYYSSKSSTMYWKGRIKLIDDSSVEIVVPEINKAKSRYFVVALKETPESATKVARKFVDRHFRSAVRAIRFFEEELNRELFRASKRYSGAQDARAD